MNSITIKNMTLHVTVRWEGHRWVAEAQWAGFLAHGTTAAEALSKFEEAFKSLATESPQPVAI